MSTTDDHSASRNTEALRRDAAHLLATAETDRSTRERATLRILDLAGKALEPGPESTPGGAARDALAEIRQLARWLYADLPLEPTPIGHDGADANEQRAVLAAHALRAHGTLRGMRLDDDVDFECAVADVVCDLGHLTAQRLGGDAFEPMLDRARRHFYEEVDLVEAGIACPNGHGSMALYEATEEEAAEGERSFRECGTCGHKVELEP